MPHCSIYITLNIKYPVFVVYSVVCRLKRISKSLYSVFIYILHSVPTSLELGFVPCQPCVVKCKV